MGFKFQKRVKLGKNFGVNISKSGVTPSYRSKKGSISTKGYSIKTGIPGLTYRKRFSKSKNGGCLIILIVISCISLFTPIVSCKEASSSNKKAWYQGGSLHKSKIVNWKSASKENKLATCADYCANIYKNRSIDEIKILAENLKSCIDEAIKDHTSLDNSSIAEVASMCIILIKN